MSRLQQIIEEIKELKNEANHRSSLRILKLIQNNKKLFLEELDEDVVEMTLRNFESLCNASTLDQADSAYVREFTKYYESLMFYLNRVI